MFGSGYLPALLEFVFNHATQAAIWENGQVDALPMIPLFGGRAFAIDINDNGWIVGEIRKSNGSSHAILLATTIPIPPIPEPSTYAMLLIGLGMLCFVVRRRKQNV